MVVKLAGLFSLDAFAGGLIVQSIVAYWFFLRYDADLTSPAMARRFGLLNTMVFTHLPSNLLAPIGTCDARPEMGSHGVASPQSALAA